MEASTVPAVEKKLYRNNTGGWLGVVTLDHDNKPQGTSVEPFGTIWLSDNEAILTARAPRRPEDNPFEEQPFVSQDPQTGRRKDIKLRPLTLESTEGRYIPANDRYVPTAVLSEGDEAGPAPKHAPEQPPPEAGPVSTGAPDPTDGQPSPVPLATPPAPALRGEPAPGGGQESEEHRSWVQEPEAPGQVLGGSLAGDDAPRAAPPDDLPPLKGHAPPQAPVPPSHGEEEHAQAVDPSVGEETGAAKPPTQPQPEGEYARAEEVGSPDAPSAEESQGLIGE